MRAGALFSRFVVAGLTVAVVQLGLLFVLERSGLFYLYASTLSFCIGIVLNFILQKYWSFRSTGNAQKQFMLFVSNSLVNIVANAGLMYLFVDLFVIPTLIAQVCAIAILMLYNFGIYSLLFKKI